MNKGDELLTTLIKCKYLEHLFGTKVKFQEEIEEYLDCQAKNLQQPDVIKSVCECKKPEVRWSQSREYYYCNDCNKEIEQTVL